MVDRFEMMTCNSEQVVNRPMDREKSLNLCRRFEATHLAFLLPSVLVGDFSSVVFVLPGSVGDGWENLSLRSRIASQLVGNKLQRWPLWCFKTLRKKRLATLLSRWRVTRISRTSPSWSTALQR